MRALHGFAMTEAIANEMDDQRARADATSAGGLQAFVVKSHPVHPIDAVVWLESVYLYMVKTYGSKDTSAVAGANGDNSDLWLKSRSLTGARIQTVPRARAATSTAPI